MPIPPLFKHQDTSVKYFKRVRRGLDASDPGTGKTRVQIERIKEDIYCGGKFLIIAPKSLLQAAWGDDFKKYAPDIHVVIVPPNEVKGLEAITETDGDVYIVTTDFVKVLAKQNKKFFDKFSTLIIDEIANFKHRTSARSKAIAKIKKHFHTRYGLTGTPASNNILDIWHQIYILDDGERLGTSFTHFRNTICYPVQVGPSPAMVRWEPKPGIVDEISELISDMTIRHKFEECIDIPENFNFLVNYKMGNRQFKAYTTMELEALIEFDSGAVASAVNAAVSVSKLLQIASGAIYTEDGNYKVIDTGRYVLAADLISQRQQCVVFFMWKHQKILVIEEFKARGISYAVIEGSTSLEARTKIVEDFQNGVIQVLLAHPKSAAHGLTLTKGTSTIWLSPTYNLEYYLQGNRRIYRAGQTQRTETIDIIAPDTIETSVLAKRGSKHNIQSQILAHLQSKRAL